MIEVIIATTNPGKAARYDRIFSELGINLTIPSKKLNVVEDGTGPDNAIKKAKAYCSEYCKPALGTDEELYFDFLSKEEQPGVNVRRFGGKHLTDEELREIFLEKIRAAPKEKRKGYFRHNICIALPSGEIYTATYEESLFFSTEPSPTWDKGYPLGSLHYKPEFGKHSCLLNEEEKKIRDKPLADKIKVLAKEAFKI